MAVWFPETSGPRSPSSVYLMLIQHLHRAVPAQPGSWGGAGARTGRSGAHPEARHQPCVRYTAAIREFKPRALGALGSDVAPSAPVGFFCGFL